MTSLIFVASLAVGMAALFCWAFKTLPNERWQMIATVPICKREDGAWEGLNLTFYGFFSATGIVFGVAVAVLLFAAIGLSPAYGLLFAATVVAGCVPLSRFVAAVVEKKKNTFTIAGAAFAAAILLPPLVWLAGRVLPTSFGVKIEMLPVLAAVIIAYALAEAIGRLACISFGCCYGLPLRSAEQLPARLFAHHPMIFHGATKKVAYASGLENEPLIPIQALTSIVFAVSGLLGLSFFLLERWRLAMIIPVLGTWGWRAFAEALRADYRGDSKISVYQAMSLVAVGYLSLVALAFPSAGPVPNLTRGLSLFRFLPLVLCFQALWLCLFCYYGRSRVTGAVLSFHVNRA